MAHASLRRPDNAAQPTGLTTPLPAYGLPEPSQLGPTGAQAAQALPTPAPVTPLKRPATGRDPVKAARTAGRSVCDLCGAGLDHHTGHYHMTSPLTARKVQVCRTCRRAALSEGYRPRA